jgi:uncharacterized cupredoxin-like copper-binding protein
MHEKKTLYSILLALTLGGASLVAHAHGERHHAPAAGPVVKEQTDWGIASEAKNATRTLEVVMTDDMRFTPGKVSVKQGETVRIVVRNAGKMMHELVIGDRESLAEHAEMMLKFPNMEHDEPYMAHVPPGETAEIVWTFNRAGDFEFACLLPGHYQAGMLAAVEVQPAERHAASRPASGHRH